MPGFHYISKGSTYDLSSKKKSIKQQFRKKCIYENIFVFMPALILFITPQGK